MIQGVILIILALWGLFWGESSVSSVGWEVTPDLLTLNRGFCICQLVLGVLSFRIPAWVGNNLKEPALVSGAINTAFIINLVYDLNADAISSGGAIINLVLTILFAVLFFVMGARHKNS